jgi:hypothetical protein
VLSVRRLTLYKLVIFGGNVSVGMQWICDSGKACRLVRAEGTWTPSSVIHSSSVLESASQAALGCWIVEAPKLARRTH